MVPRAHWFHTTDYGLGKGVQPPAYLWLSHTDTQSQTVSFVRLLAGSSPRVQGRASHLTCENLKRLTSQGFIFLICNTR